MLGLIGMVPSGIKMALVAALVALVGAAFWHYTIVKNERDSALAQAGALKVANQVQHATIDAQSSRLLDFKESEQKMQETLEALAQSQQDAAQYQKELNDVLNRDLDRISAGKPSMLERRINRGTARVLGMFECATGGCEDDNRGPPGSR